MNELDANLLSGEQIVFATRKHWFSPVRDSAIAVLLILGFLLVRGLGLGGEGLFGTIGNLIDTIAFIALLVGIAWIAFNIFAFFSANFGVTNMRVLRYEGLIQRRSSETLLSSVSDVRLKEPALGRMLGFGDLQIFTSSGEAGKDEFSTIRDAAKMRTFVQEEKTRPPGEAAPIVAPPAPPAATPVSPDPGVTAQHAASAAQDPAAALARLADLHTQGLITDAEYEAKRTEIVSRI